ncbi:IclR family transcriptional regulator [Achromobacter aloeverae]|uniref:IclR family transcriptional regulator n=1 Tax=Achromobacter aloeverae TaxID=1750518 RepID=A0A4Q1HFZ3_9BURK|nr:IclR family transcriptional regulator [Achromobacter aloeverae]RXN85938.1 IclR family transcriptional regulator [Achromobacter aloeverae]
MQSNPAPAPRDTAQSLRRSIEILKTLSAPMRRGFSLSELSKLTGLPHPTVLRLLRHLTDMGMVAWNADTKIYRLGPLTFELGLAAAEHCDIRGVCGDTLDRLQAETQDTCYLTLRSGFDAVCIDRREGVSPIRVLTLDIGSRRPLGVGAAGLAILNRLPDEEAEAIIQSSEPKLDRYNRMSLDIMRMLLRETRERGYAVCGNWVTLGVTAIAVPVCTGDGRPLGALSISAVNHRMPAERWPTLFQRLDKEARLIQKKLQGAAPP